MTGGRKKGEEDKQSFYRKGISGDWKASLTEKEQSLFKELMVKK